MYDPKLYRDGIGSILLAEWTLRCEKPLVVRNGKRIKYTDTTRYVKDRGGRLHFAWSEPQQGDPAHEISALAYGYEVQGNRLTPRYRVPASALRGSLRSWTVRELVDAAASKQLLPRKDETAMDKAARQKELLASLECDATGLPLLASLFGMALDTNEGEANWSNAGRLQVETDPFASAQPKSLSANAQHVEGDTGPANAATHMAVRNPLDRITHAARGRGLHHFIEFSEGEAFTARLRILNPKPSDVGLLSAWRREINDGMLRLGALGSIGRGRLALAAEQYTLWRLATTPLDLAQWPGFAPAVAAADDPLAGLYAPYTLPAEALPGYEGRVLEEVS